MLFFKPKQKSDEILPPPPPFPTLEIEEESDSSDSSLQLPKKTDLFDDIIKPNTLGKEEFSDLLKDSDKELKPKKTPIKKEKINIKSLKKKSIKIKQPKKQKIFDSNLQQLKEQLNNLTSNKKTLTKKVKAEKIPLKTLKLSKKELPKEVKKSKPKKAKIPTLEEDYNLEDLDFGLPEDLEKNTKKEIELPDTLEDLDIKLEKERVPEERSKLILEAEDEIKNAIENIKHQEKPSLFKRLFAKKKEEKPAEEQLMQELPSADELLTINNNINKARQALMKFDLESAKNAYTEIMRLYNKLEPEKQAKVYHDIKDLYFERKSAEELKV